MSYAAALRERSMVSATDDPRVAGMPIGDFFTRIDRDPESFGRLQAFARRFGVVDSPAKVWILAGPLLEHEDGEVIWTLNLDVHGLFRGIHPAHKGSIDEVEAVLPHVFRAAVKDEARGCFLLHNHPSGDSLPSEADEHLTAAAHNAVRQLRPLRLYDHCILGFGEMYSFKAGRRWQMQ